MSQPLSRLAHVSSPAAPSRFYVQPMLLPLLKEMPAGQLGVDLTCRATQLVTMGEWQGVEWVWVGGWWLRGHTVGCGPDVLGHAAGDHG